LARQLETCGQLEVVYYIIRTFKRLEIIILLQSDGKWNMTFEDWPWNEYPPYFLGPVVLFPSSTILPLLAALQTTPMMPIDDVYYSGMCTEKAGVVLRFSSNSTR
jgi:hypothetical protein